jgi:acid phosphatase (class A)
MAFTSKAQNPFVRLRRLIAPLVLCWLLSAPIPLFAQQHYLAPGHPDGVALLPPPPAAGSVEETADLDSVRAVFKGRTPAEEKRALKDAGLSFSIFPAAIGPVFDPAKLPKTQALLKRVKDEIGMAIDTPKNYFKRQRPYQMDEHLSLGAPERSFSYPSGHSTRGTVYSLVLAELFPDKRPAILEVGRNLGWDRVLLGKHFPSDVYAGRVLGQALVRELLTSPSFQHDLLEAKAEIQAAEQVPVPASAAR